MDLFEACLFKLCERGTITLGQARIINAIRRQKACSKLTLASETGIRISEIDAEIRDLEKMKIISKTSGIYHCPSLPEKLAELIPIAEICCAITPDK